MSDDIVWNEGMIARAISTQTLARKCVVLVDNCNWTGHECDVLGVTTDLRIIDVEVKISRSDLKADAKKDKWWNRPDNWRFNTTNGGGFGLIGPPCPDLPKEHPRKVWKHYYALPKEIWKPELLDCLPSKSSGVLLLKHYKDLGRDFIWVTCERRATPAKDAYRLKPAEVMDIASLANLRMWESYKREEDARHEASDFYHGRRQTLVPYKEQAVA